MVEVNVLGSKMILRILRAKRFKKPYTLADFPPWSRHKMHTAGLSPAQQKVVEAFTKVAKATAEMPLHQRMEVIAAVLKGKDFGGVTKRVRYPAKSREEIKRLIDTLRAQI